jgi:hypothetical protein
VEFNPRFVGPPSPYMGEPHPEVDRLWYDLAERKCPLLTEVHIIYLETDFWCWSPKLRCGTFYVGGNKPVQGCHSVPANRSLPSRNGRFPSTTLSSELLYLQKTILGRMFPR